MMKKMYLRVAALVLIALMTIPTYVFLASSASGYIKVNANAGSAQGVQVQAGGNVNLYFGDVAWGGSEFYLLMSLDNYQQVSIPDVIYTPKFAVSDLLNSTATKIYTSGIGAWTLGNNWVNGTIAQNIGVGNYTIKGFDEVTGTVAVTDVFLIVSSVVYSSNLIISPPSGPGGITAQFTGSGFPPSSAVTVAYFDPTFGSWNHLADALANATGDITFTSEIPDLRRALGPGDYPEAYQRISYRAQIHDIVYCYADYNQYSRGLKRVGNQTANGLYGNGTNLASTVNVLSGDKLTLSGKWFHPGDVVYVKWDGQTVVGTAFGSQANAVTIGNTIANSAGSFEISVTIPQANTGAHFMSIEDSQARVIIRINATTQTLYISPASGPGGIKATLTGSRYAPSSPVTISYLDPTYSWKTFGSTISDASGNIQFTAEMPDMRRSLTAYDSYESFSSVSFRTEQGGSVCCTADYVEYSRGLKTVGNQTAKGLYGNGTNLASNVKVAPGDTLTISGRWFHVGDVVYLRWDGQAVVGTVTGNEWLNAQIIGNYIANSTGGFQTTVTIPRADAGEHYLAVEDSQAKVIIKVAVSGEPVVNSSSTRTPSIIDLSCKGSTSYIGYRVEINGTLAINRTGISGAQVVVSYSANEGISWQDLTSVYSDPNGGFYAVWMPSVSGSYLVKARYDGNSSINGTSKVVALASAPYSDRNVFSVTSNSTVTALSFNSANDQLTFTVTGENGTKGYVDVGIAKSLIANISSLRVYLDGANQAFNATSNSDSWFIHIGYSHSTHNVVIDIGQSVPSSPNATMTPTPSENNPTSNESSSPNNTPTSTPEPMTTGTSNPTPKQSSSARNSPSPEPTSIEAIPKFPFVEVLIAAITGILIIAVVAKKKSVRDEKAKI